MEKRLAFFFIFFLGILLAFTHVKISAQAGKTPPELSIYVGGGFSFAAFPYPDSKSSSFGGHACGGLGITAFFNRQWGFHTGVGVGINNLKINVDKIMNLTYLGKNDENSSELPGYEAGFNRELHTTLEKYHEKHKTMFLNIPVMLQFQTKPKYHFNWRKGQKSTFYAMTGLHLLLLLDNKYDMGIQNLNNMAYYPEIDNWAGSQSFKGLGRFEGNGKNGSFGISVLAMFAFEAGVKWRIREKTYLYTGVYYNCGLHDPVKKYRTSPNEYITPESVDKINILAFSNRVNAMAIGIKLQLAFALKQKREVCHR